jgi:hypothetical protein
MSPGPSARRPRYCGSGSRKPGVRFAVDSLSEHVSDETLIASADAVGSPAEYIVQDLATPDLIITIEVSAPAQG